MERLTIKNRKGFYVEKCHVNKSELIKKLAEYEQAEEDGLLIRLPCKVGDTVYTFNVIENKVEEINVDTLAFIMFISEFGALGKTVFLTKAEAEQALAKMKGGVTDGRNILQTTNTKSQGRDKQFD